MILTHASVQQRPFRARAVSRHILLLAVAAVLALLGWTPVNADAPQSPAIQMHVDPATGSPGQEFEVTYTPKRLFIPASDVGKGTSIGVLRGSRTGRRVATLIVRGVLGTNAEGQEIYPAVVPPRGPRPLSLVPGPGPDRFVVPDVRPGTYYMCAFIMTTRPHKDRTDVKACAKFIVLP